jgi:hypothetical protein
VNFDRRIGGEEMKRTSLILIQLLICTLLLGTLSFAHGNMEHILGTVTEITESSLSVRTRDGATKAVKFDSETKFVKGDSEATIKDLRVGSRVVIHAHNKNNSLYAAEIKIGEDAGTSQH